MGGGNISYTKKQRYGPMVYQNYRAVKQNRDGKGYLKAMTQRSTSTYQRTVDRLPAEAYTQPATFRHSRLDVNMAMPLSPDAYASNVFYIQDIQIVEKVQKDLRNRAYDGGRMCYRFEEPLHRFQNVVIDRILGIDRIPDGDDEI